MTTDQLEATTSCLSRPLRLPCGVVLPNRLARAALTEQLADAAHAPTQALVRLYARWAHGGAGLGLTGNVMIDRRALCDLGDVAIEDERWLGELSQWATAG